MNTGDPVTLLDFINWARFAHPAERYGLILWNHGNGWKDTDIYRTAQKEGVAARITRGQVRGLALGQISRALFSTTLEHLVAKVVKIERAILFDDSSADYLDNIELRMVLQKAVDRLKHEYLRIINGCFLNLHIEFSQLSLTASAELI